VADIVILMAMRDVSHGTNILQTDGLTAARSHVL
jgi:hypothetical protein